MTPQEFAAKSAEAIAGQPGTYRTIAGPDNASPTHQAALYYSRTGNTGARQFIVHVADRDPESTAFAAQTISSSNIRPGVEGYHVDGLNLTVFRGLGEITIPAAYS